MPEDTLSHTTSSRRPFKQISFKDRQLIEFLYRKKIPVPQIALDLGFHRSTIYRELKRGRVSHLDSELREFSTYSADRAHDVSKLSLSARGPDLKIHLPFYSFSRLISISSSRVAFILAIHIFLRDVRAAKKCKMQQKNVKSCKFALTGVKHRDIVGGMPNKPDIYKRILNLRVDRETYEKVRKLAKQRKCTMSDVVLRWIIDGTLHVNLTPEDHEEIARQIREAAARR